jgi:hypothetical protein
LWRESAYQWIHDLPVGTTFICEDVVIALRERGVVTENYDMINWIVSLTDEKRRILLRTVVS